MTIPSASTMFIAPDPTDERLTRRRDYQMLIGGRDCASESGETIEREAPGHAGIIVGRYPRGSARDVDAAVQAARAAFDTGPWPRLSAAERSRALMRVAGLLRDHAEELATIETLEVGKPIAQARKEVGGSIDLWEYAAGQLRGLHGDVHTELAPDVIGMVLREPVGVVGIITPWNFPLVIASERLPWAIGVGCTVVIKPSEFTSGTTIRLGQLIREAGIPDGVVNVVTGHGDPVGEAISRHPDIDMVAFTGSIRVGRIIGANAAGTVKRVGLELGGKGPQVVFPDADLEAAVDGAVFGLLYNNGQCCVSGSRLLLHRDIAEPFLEALVDAMGRVSFGDPLNEATMVGAVINPAQLDKIAGHVATGTRDGAKLRLGGKRAGSGAGLYFEPTIFTDVTPQMGIARDEIFGPVLSVVSFTDADEAVRIVNDSSYGLSASVWTRDIANGLGTIRRIRAGKTWINGVIEGFSDLPFGGYKQSGVGRETGRYGFDQYTEFKTLHVLYGKRDLWVPPRAAQQA